MNENNWHHLSTELCFNTLNSSKQGLSAEHARKRLLEQGPNKLPMAKKISLWARIFKQFNNILIHLLILAALVTLFLEHWVDCSVIVAVILLNALIGVIQEGRAEKAIDALKQLLTQKALVVREGKKQSIDASQLVPGDVINFCAGDKLGADVRLIEAHNLQVDEAMLTGESLPVDKAEQAIIQDAPLSERTCMLYSGTFVVEGSGQGLVVHTGLNTEIGRISKLLETSSPFSTPLLRQMAQFGRKLAAFILLFALFLFLFGVFVRHYPLQEVFLAAVAMAVAIIPEGLPAIITIILALGVTRMSSHRAIVRRLASVETLSSVTVICTDKTGTLTKNELTVQRVLTHERAYDVTGSGYNDQGQIIGQENQAGPATELALDTLIKAGALCNDAELNHTDEHWQLNGNPLDGALLALSLKASLQSEKLMKQCPRTATIPFSSIYKFMATSHENNKGMETVFVKGAPEKLLRLCSLQLTTSVDPIDTAYWQEKMDELAGLGLRVLALAYKAPRKSPISFSFQDLKKDLIFLGLVGIIDPPRQKVDQAIKACQQAGIRVKMITGDHPLTAKAIANRVGISTHSVLTGEALDQLDDKAFAQAIDDTDVFARTVPEHKIRLVKALKDKQHIVAMTGDGVNDAPALNQADIGISMGIKGTEVAKQASEIVLTDDNFASIQQAVEEGRNVYNNLKKAILFILPTSGAEGLAIFLAILLGLTLPVTPIQILWVNMVTTVTLAIALGFEPPEHHLMESPPRRADEAILSPFLLWRLSFVSVLFLVWLFGLFLYARHQGASLALARTMTVDVLVLLEVGYLINCRRIHQSVLNKEGLLGSKPVLMAIVLVLVLQIGFTHLSIMHYFFKTEALNLKQWLMIVTLTVIGFFIIEIEKWLLRWWNKTVT